MVIIKNNGPLECLIRLQIKLNSMLIMSVSAPLIVSSFKLYNVLFQNSVIFIDDSSDREWSPGKKRIK